jgi:hypothetical protein
MALSTIDYTGISQLTGPIGSAANIPLTLQVNGGTTAITVSTSGLVGISNTTPTYPLQISGGVGSAGVQIVAGQFPANIALGGGFNGIAFSNTNSGGGAVLASNANSDTRLWSNAYYQNGQGETYITSQAAGKYNLSQNSHTWSIAGAGTAGSPITFVNALQLNSSGNLVFGVANAGIVFNNSSASVNSTLNDYETGTWTPYFYLSGSQPTITYSLQAGFYTKIGNLVKAQARITVSSTSGGSGAVYLKGMPFQAVNVTGEFGALQTIYVANMGSAPSYGRWYGPNSFFELYYWPTPGTASETSATASGLTSSTDLIVQMVYTANF